MSSKPSAQCCTVGVRHEGEPTGFMTKFDGIDAYVAEPKGDTIYKDVAILYLSDITSIWQNSQLMADQFAANGYYCFMPDLFNGDPLPINLPKGFNVAPWLAQGSTGDNPHTYPYVDPIVEKALKVLRDEKGFKKVGGVGYCFGAKYVVRYMPKGKGVDIGYIAHPSGVEEDELKAIDGPLSIAAAVIDPLFPPENRHKSELILQETKQQYQCFVYSGVNHGFAVKCDLSIKIQKFAKEQAFLQAIAWFDEYLI